MLAGTTKRRAVRHEKEEHELGSGQEGGRARPRDLPHNRAIEANIDAEHAASYASDFKIGNFQAADASLYSTRHDLVERMDELFDLTPDEKSILEDREMGDYA